MIENIAEIETALGIPAGQFKTMYEDAEAKNVDLTPFEIVKKTDLATRIDNIKAETRTAAVEIAVKEARTKHALDFTGKTMDNLFEAFKTKVIADAKIEPNKKVVELEADLTKMRTNASDWEKKYGDLSTSTAAEKRQFQIESTISSKMPKVKTKIPVQDMSIIFKAKYKPVMDEHGTILFHNEKGEVIKNTSTLSPSTIDEIMTEFQTIYIEKPDGGDGGGDGSGAGKPGSYEAFKKEMASKEIVEGSQKFSEEMKIRIKNKTLTT